MTFDAVGATAVVGAVAIIVVLWGAWISLGSLRHGPAWALDQLSLWRPLPWVLGIAGLGAVFLVDPVWVGLGVVYIALVTGWIIWAVRRNLDRVRQAYGGFDEVSSQFPMGRMGSFLVAGALLLGAIAIWDVSVRGWTGLFGLALAVCLGGVGLALRRAG